MKTKVILLYLLVLSLIGCGSALVPVVRTIPNCPISIEFMDSCSSPATIDDDSTYGDLLQSYLKDRQSLESCRLRHQYLVSALSECNDAIDRLNVEIEKNNKTARKIKD